MRSAKFLLALSAVALSHAVPAAAQNALDRGDPGIIEEEFERQLPREQVDDVTLPVADPDRISTVDADDGVFVGAIRVEGSSLPASRFVPVISDYVGRILSPEDLQQLSGAIAGVLREEGYIFASARVAPQRLDAGMLRITVDEGSIEDIRYVGARNSAVERILAPLADGEPVAENRLERRLLLAADVPGIRITNTQFFRRDGTGTLQVSVAQDDVEGWARLSNDGSEAVGPWRFQAGVAVNSAIADGDRLRISTSATPFEPGDFALIRLSYDIPLGDDGTTVGFSGYYAHSEPEDDIPSADRDGDSIGASVAVRHPFIRSRAGSLWGSFALSYRETMQDDNGIPIREDRVTTAELGLNGFLRVGNAHLSGGTRLTQGLGIFDASREGDALTSRFDGSGVFTKAEFFGRFWKPLGGGFSVELTGRAQLASRELLAGDEFGIGGPYYGRGFDYYERSGENGIAGAMELRYDIRDVSEAIDNIQFYGFFDAAGVRNLGNGGGGGRLTSAGAGLRAYMADSIRIGLEAGFPLNTDRFDSGDRSPRLRFSIGADF
ncbi:MAG: ShlB/FhaC/HecB family hemolysin secretion/activation protein [Parasphingopyxis sp.]|uniref:ShlB/FhaC/HecB family hemolysin secretion/activation protein n=1 Tax=Parasphingopyxis sp. TaxID=1920299 RepID=UPI003FA0F469